MNATTTKLAKQRDLRLDFFRGIAMFIILLAHTPGNTWTLWIPARFGFSDATEIFVFCSGMASALAFGVVFAKKSWFLGAARIAFRVWQVYWAHIGVFLATALLMIVLDQTGWGEAGKTYADWPSVVRFFTHTKETLLGLFTLTFVPGLFDILPMYLVILAMVPFVMLAHRFGGVGGVVAMVLSVWLAAQLGHWAHTLRDGTETHAFGALLAEVGSWFSILNLPGSPWTDRAWFFNPFGWQLVFFTGFAFGMKWLPAPPVNQRLVLLAAGYLLISLPFAWFKIHQGLYLPDAWLLHDWIYNAREWMQPLIWKTGVGGLRFLHFLAIAYLAWAAVGPGGARLYEGWRAPKPPKGAALVVLAVVAVATTPYAYVDEIKSVSPWLDQQIFAFLDGFGLIPPDERLGLLQLLHLFALLPLVWAAIGAGWREWVVKDGFLATVPVIRKVGTQSLAVFMVSIVLSRFNGWWLDIVDRDVWSRALVNITGFVVLIAVAYSVGWFKSQPWRREVKPQVTEITTSSVARRSPAE